MPRKKELRPEDYSSAFPTRLRDIMSEQGKTQQEVADEIGKTRQAVGYYADGSSSPDWKTLAKLARYFGVSADWLLGISEVKSLDGEVKQVCEYTGLTEAALKMVLTYKNAGAETDNRTIKRLGWIFNELLASTYFFHLLRRMSCYIDTYSAVYENFSEDNYFRGNDHELDGLYFCDDDILELRTEEAKNQLEALLYKIAEKAEEQSSNPLVYWNQPTKNNTVSEI